MAKKFDNNNVAMNFLSQTYSKQQEQSDIEPVEAKEPLKPVNNNVQVPDGYVLKRETKSARVQLLIRESLKKKLQKQAKKEKKSLNELINTILEEYINEREM